MIRTAAGLNRKSRRMLVSFHRRRKLRQLPLTHFTLEEKQALQIFYPTHW